MKHETAINFGDEVKDRVTGFYGIAMAAHFHATNCTQIYVVPKASADNKLDEGRYFDETRLEVLRERVVTFPALAASEKPGASAPPPARR